MKRVFIILLTIVLGVGMVFGLTACKKKEKSVDLTTNISYAETQRFVGIGEDYKASVTSGIREKTFIIDGKADGVCTFTEIRVIPLKASSKSDKYEYTLYYEGGEVSGELIRDVVTHNFKAEIDGEAFKDKISSVTIKCGEKSEEIPLTDALIGKITYNEVLDIASAELKDEIGANTTDGVLNREIVIKLIRDRRNVDSPYYWYISFISADNTYWALLINPETKEIISKKA